MISRKLTLVFLAIFCVTVTVAFVVGFMGNPPGLLLCFTAAAALIFAFAESVFLAVSATAAVDEAQSGGS